MYVHYYPLGRAPIESARSCRPQRHLWSYIFRGVPRSYMAGEIRVQASRQPECWCPSPSIHRRVHTACRRRMPEPRSPICPSPLYHNLTHYRPSAKDRLRPSYSTRDTDQPMDQRDGVYFFGEDGRKYGVSASVFSKQYPTLAMNKLQHTYAKTRISVLVLLLRFEI